MDTIPYNKVGNAKPESMADIAENEGISEEEWRAQNLPASKLEFRWRYTNKTIHLYERRLRSLGSFNVGPAVQAWVRSRLEWVRDNKLYEMPDGAIVLTIDPEGMVDTQLEELHPAPQFTRAMLDADEVPGTLWVAKDGQLLVGQTPRHAADTLVRDLATTLGYEVMQTEAPSDDGAEVFAVSDEFGIIPVEGTTGPVISKLSECFDKLWSLDK